MVGRPGRRQAAARPRWSSTSSPRPTACRSIVEELTKTILGSGILRDARRPLRADRAAAGARHPGDTAGIADGAPRPAAAGARGGAAGRGAGPRVRLRDARGRGRRSSEPMLQERSGPAGRGRAALPARPPAAGALHLQARADPGCGLPVAAEAHPPADTTQQVAEAAGERVSRGRSSTQPELVAHHYTEAGCRGAGDRVLAQGGRAAAASNRRNVEAIAHLGRGLAAARSAAGYAASGPSSELDLQMHAGPGA